MNIEFKEFRSSLSDVEKRIWDLLNLGFSVEEVQKEVNLTKWTYHRVWNKIVQKGVKYFGNS